MNLGHAHVLGVTLIELLISLAMSLTLTVLFLGCYQNSLQHHAAGLARWQMVDSARVIDQTVRRAVHQAGYCGCRSCPKALVSFNIDAHLPANLSHAPRAHGVSLYVSHLATPHAYLHSPSHDQILEITDQVPIKPGQTWLVADCRHSERVRIAAVQSYPARHVLHAITTQPLQHHFPRGSAVGQWLEEWYYVGDTGRRSRRGQYPIYALYRHRLQGRDVEIADHLANWRIQRSRDRELLTFLLTLRAHESSQTMVWTVQMRPWITTHV